MPKPLHAATISKYGTAVVAGEKAYINYSRRERWDGTSPLVLAFHGADGNERFNDPVTASGVNHLYCQAIAAAGFVVISSLWGGETWGNDAGTAKVAEAVTWAGANGIKTTKVGAYAGSHGAAVALNYWKANPSKVGACVLIVPALNLDNVYTDNVTQQADMNAAYGGSYATNGLAHSPHRFSGDIDGLAPVLVYYANDDTVIRAADVTSFATAMGVNATELGAGGHAALGGFVASVGDMIAAYSALRAA